MPALLEAPARRGLFCDLALVVMRQSQVAMPRAGRGGAIYTARLATVLLFGGIRLA